MDMEPDMSRVVQLKKILLLFLTVVGAGTVVLQAPYPQIGEASFELPRPLMASGHSGGGFDTGQAGYEVVEVDAPTVSHLEAQLASLGYGTDGTFQRVPRVRIGKFPQDISEIAEPEVRKRIFLQTMVPLILMENERILAERARLQELLPLFADGRTPSAYDMAWLIDIKERYEVSGTLWSPSVRSELLRRVDTVPVSLALAMSAFESGWGTSRFAEVANNLFGHWTFQPGTGVVPLNRLPGRTHELKVFPDLGSSVHAYIMNLNSHWAYEKFRTLREKLARTNTPNAPVQLALSLLRYSERGEAYTHDVARLIRVNRLERFDSARLDGSAEPQPYAQGRRGLAATTSVS